MKLSLLQFVSSQYQDVSLEKICIIGCQHILGTTFDLFEELFQKGLKPENVYLIGKCYSTNRSTLNLFREKGVHVSDKSLTFDNQVSFDEQFQQNVVDFFKEIVSSVDLKSFEKIVILDDGGYLISLANDLFQNRTNIVGVEQTTSGYEKIKSLQLHFPVINVARSFAKLEIESVFIAETASRKIEKYLSKYIIKNPRILVIGNGAIGKAMAVVLKDKYLVSSCDIVENKCDFGGDFKNHLGEFDVIIGATGVSSIQPSEFDRLKQGALLISVSSSDREFSAVDLRRLVPKIVDCHQDVQVNGITLLNCGFPINFNDGKQHSVAPEKIQLTRSLLLAGILEGVTKKFSNCLEELDVSLQKSIIQKFEPDKTKIRHMK